MKIDITKPIADFMKNQRISFTLTAQIFPPNNTYLGYISRRWAPLLEIIHYALLIAITFHITILTTIALFITFQKGVFENTVYLISQLIVYLLMPFQLVYFKVRSQACNDMMGYMNEHFLTRSARGKKIVRCCCC